MHDLSNLFRFTLIFLEVGHGKTKLNRWTEGSPKMRNLHRCHSWQKISKYEKQQMHTDWGNPLPRVSRGLKMIFCLTGGSEVAITVTGFTQRNLFIKIVSVPHQNVLTAERLFFHYSHMILMQIYPVIIMQIYPTKDFLKKIWQTCIFFCLLLGI